MDLIQDAFKRLFPEKLFTYNTKVKYSSKFRPYNSNIKMRNGLITLNLSRLWKGVDYEILIGLVQELLIKLFKEKKQTRNMEMYNFFIKNLHIAAPKISSDPLLEGSFYRVNTRFFDGIIEIPNLKFGSDSYSKLGSYEYATDTITISNALKGDFELLDYVMYHELLHKKFKFSSKNGRSRHHTFEFRKWEKKFPDYEILERRLGRMKLKNTLFKWF